MKLPKVYGVTHDDLGELTARVPRAIKTAIGMPKDSGLHVFIALNKEKTANVFCLEIGRAQAVEQRTYALTDAALLKRDYAALMKDDSVVKRRAPQKLAYFTFFKEAGDGTYIHDIDVIAKHGPRPREIDVIITEDGALRAAYEFWDAKGLKCHGDGRDAMRSINFVTSKDDEEAAKQAKESGRIWFPIVDGCFTRGCPYSQTVKNKKGYDTKQCGLHGSLAFQLVNDIRLGAKAEFSTTGGKSVRQLMASLVELATFTGGGDPERGTVRGIPLVLSVGQFKTNHNGQPGTAFAVRLEFRAESVGAIQRKIQEAAATFGGMMPVSTPAKQIAQPEQKQIEAPKEEVVDAEFTNEPADDDDVEAGFRQSQFTEGDDDAPEEAEAAATETFDQAKADLMMAAEGATTVTSPGEPVNVPVAEESETKKALRGFTLDKKGK